jgi:hypothetical protein
MKYIKWNRTDVGLESAGMTDGSASRAKWTLYWNWGDAIAWSLFADGTEIKANSPLAECITYAESYEQRTNIAGIGSK